MPTKPLTILAQAMALGVIGAAIGLAHSAIRPVTIDRPPPPSIDSTIASGAAGGVPAIAPADTHAPAPAGAKPTETPPTPAVTKPAAPEPAKPSKAELTPELKAKGHITIDEAFALFSMNPPAFFVDTRHKADYHEGHIPGAFRIPLAAFEGKPPFSLQLIERESPVVVYCIGGNCDESEAVAKQFNLAGYKKVYVLHDGFPGWKAAGKPVETGPGQEEEAD
jgi:rhodanese-related sulfurtransferase